MTRFTVTCKPCNKSTNHFFPPKVDVQGQEKVTIIASDELNIWLYILGIGKGGVSIALKLINLVHPSYEKIEIVNESIHIMFMM